MTQSEPDRLAKRVGRNDIWLQWPDNYRPPCAGCDAATIGLLDRGRHTPGGLQIRTTAEPCGCELNAAQVHAMQTAAVAADAVLL